ncbi:OB-fold domain-containing protein [Nocardia sp. R6R-6]|uniref:OB-fold domain-containing protein n=1 Tax=Nocardia sp. R6R-6 TaxID=3459303 RepID=UPI00403DA38B
MYPHHQERTENAHDDSAPRPLMIRRCAACDKLFDPLTTACSSCRSRDLEGLPSSGVGSIVSWRVADRVACGSRRELVPSTIAIVALDEGPWVYTMLEGERLPPVDQPVRVQFQPRSRGGRFPVFAIISDQHASNGSAHLN